MLLRLKRLNAGVPYSRIGLMKPLYAFENTMQLIVERALNRLCSTHSSEGHILAVRINAEISSYYKAVIPHVFHGIDGCAVDAIRISKIRLPQMEQTSFFLG